MENTFDIKSVDLEMQVRATSEGAKKVYYLVNDTEIHVVDTVDANREFHYWYGGEVIKVKHKGYTLSIEAVGDVRMTLFDGEEELAYVKDKSNAGNFYHVMDLLIQDDVELRKILDNDSKVGKHFDKENNNWWECFITDKNGTFHDIMWALDADTISDALQEVMENMDDMIKQIEE